MAAARRVPPGFGTKPWLVQGTPGGETLTFVDPFDGRSHTAVVPETRGKTCLGCVCDGEWLLMLDESTGECFLLCLTDANPRTNRVTLPPLQQPLECLRTCALLESPTHQSCAVVVAVSRRTLKERFLLCHPGDREWTGVFGLQTSDLMINYRGWIYGFGFGNWDTLEVMIGTASAAADGAVRVQLTGTLSGGKEEHDRVSRYHVVESCGDLYAVCTEQFGFWDEADGTLTGIAVFRLDLGSMAWRRVESIGDDRAFLISGNYGFSWPAAAHLTTGTGGEGLAMQGNCVYLVWSSCDCERLYKFCLDDMTITFHQILPQPTLPWCRAFWAVPKKVCHGSMELEAMAAKESALSLRKEVCESISKHLPLNHTGQPCQDLPVELLELIVSKGLSLVDRLRFPAVCKSWSMVSNPVEEAEVWPWLLHCSRQDGTCRLLDPLRGEEYTKRVHAFDTDEHEHIFRSSKDGWVAVSAGVDIDDIFVINPFTGDIVELPMFDWKYDFSGMSFSSSNPTLSDCVFFGVTTSDSFAAGVHTWRHDGEYEWREQEMDQAPFPVAYNNPVFFRGKFYCLGRKGDLATFDPSTSGGAWTVLEKPEPVHTDMDLYGADHEGREFCYLVELRGELVSVFMRNADEPPRVLKLREPEMAWVEMQEIGGAALFLDFRASYSVASPERSRGNRIYFPRYSETEDGRKQVAFYDMETRTYCPSFYGLKQPLQCVWVVPNLQPT